MSMQFPKPAASLSSALMARKGAARPGQRYTQDMSFVEPVREAFLQNIENQNLLVQRTDLAVPAFPDITQNTAANDVALADHLIEPVDVEHVDQIIEPILWPIKVPVEKQYMAQSVPAEVAAPKRRSAPGQKARCAFTLRLDPERHLKLRLISAHQHRSAQLIVTEALDRFLADLNSGTESGSCVCRSQPSN